jgi:PAS domain S-box-containing protein
MKISLRRYFIELLFLFLLYFAAAKLGLQLAPIGGFASLVWAPSGIALAALFLFGSRLWPAVVLGAFLINMQAGAPVPAAFAIAVGNTFEPILGAFFLRRIIGFHANLERIKDILGLVIFAAAISTLVSATIGVTSLWISGVIPSSNYGITWRAWWIGDALGDIMVASFFFAWSAWRRQELQPRKIAEAVVLMGAAIGFSLRIFCGVPSFDAIGSPEAYLLFSLIIWSALRFSARETITAALLISIIAIHGTIGGNGPFSGRTLSENLLFLQLFMGVLTATGMLLAAAISERREAREEFRLLVESTPCAMLMVNSRGRILLVNSQTEKIFGYARTELQGQPVEMLVPDRFKGNHHSLCAKFFAEPKSEQLSKGHDFAGLRKNGSEVQVDIALNPVMTSDGMQVLCSIVNVTERKRSEDAQRFLAQAGEIIAGSLDFHTTIKKAAHLTLPGLADWCLVDLAVNGTKQFAAAHPDVEKEKMAEELANRFPPDAALGRGAAHVVQTGKSEVYPEVTDSSWVATTLGPGHPRILRELGAVSYMCVPLIAREHVLGSITFIFSESKRRYDLFHLALAEELARRTAMAIDNAQLYLVAQKAIRVRDDFLAIVSHDLKNPLYAIISGASLIIETSPSGEENLARTIAEKIIASAQRMAGLIRDLLDLTKLEEDHLVIEPRQVEADTLIDEALAPFELPLKAKKLRLIKKVAGEVGFVLCDKDRILQVISNLVENAAKFTPDGGIITVSARPLEREVEFSVKDTGPGIPDNQLAHVFDRFWQAEKARSRGLGLGLSIAQGLVAAHGGRIWVESTTGAGSTFFFTLPRASGKTGDQ